MKIDWLAEGISVANGRQKSYLSLGEVLSRAAKESLGPVIDPALHKGPLDMRFAYPVWRYFNEYLMTHHGRETYQGFLVAVAADPPEWRSQFERSFGRRFADEIEAFEETLHSAER